MKVYGNEKTDLVLTDKAARMYAECDPLQIVEHEDGTYSIRGIEDRDGMSAEDVNRWLEELADDTANLGEEEIIKIGRVNIKSETFCTKWHDKLYCVDICEDADERSAWLYNSAYAVKALMFGEAVTNSRDAFLDRVFSNLPDYISFYAEQYED